MTSKERLLATWSGATADSVPLTAWCFGVEPERSLTWEKNGVPRKRWYSLRMEHIHTLPQPWEPEDEFRRVHAWQSPGVDTTIDVSVPWGTNPGVDWKDETIPPGPGIPCPVLVREYRTPAGTLRHAVKMTGEEPGEGWVVQPDRAPLFEDYNIPRAVKHAVEDPSDIGKIAHLYTSPGPKQKDWFEGRMAAVVAFARGKGFAVQAWPAFGMDGVVWLAGVQGAIFMAVDDPASFERLVRVVFEADCGRTELACSHPSVDIVTQRGWYGSTDFWSPRLFVRFQFPYIKETADIVHGGGKKFGYVVTKGVAALGARLAEAGVDVLYFVDPLQDGLSARNALDLFQGRTTLVGGINTLTLASRDEKTIGAYVREAFDALGPTKRFILHPVDALHPDTPWEGVEILIDAWKACR